MSEMESTRPRIVVGVDGSPGSKLALRWAARLAKSEDARIDALGAWEFPTYVAYGSMSDGFFPEDEMQKLVTDTVDEVFGAERPNEMRVLTVRGPADVALLNAGKHALMLVVGSRGHGGFAGLLLGSVSAKVAEHASCPVLVVHEPRTHGGAAS